MAGIETAKTIIHRLGDKKLIGKKYSDLNEDQVNLLGYNLKPDNSEYFWMLLGFDQLLHQLTYIGIIWIILNV